MSESEVYEILKIHEIPNMPETLKSGDVFAEDGSVHCTRTDEFVRELRACAPTWIRQHFQHRVVQRLALPLHMVRSSRELVQAIFNVLVGTCVSL